MADLKPCPFCGGHTVEFDESLDAIYCHDCGASGAHADTEDEAAAAWNRRAQDVRGEVMEWQPIETAPKDGTCILVSNEYGSWIAKYVPEYQSGYRPAVPWMSMMLNHDHMRWGVRALVPTNWQPLPALRAAAGEPPKDVIDVSLAIRALGKALELAGEAPLHAEDDEWRAEYEHLSGIWRAWVIEFRSGEPPKEPNPT
jgi:Lar family restriction alleviation protein